MMMSVKPIALAIIAGCVATVAAQSSKAPFEVVSVKPNTSKAFPLGPEARPGGAFIAANITLESMIRFAYTLPAYRVIGGPAWIRTDRFDVDARAAGDPAPEEIRRMVQRLLADRFQLVVRTEQREMALYTLLLARDDGRLGPGIRQSAAGCAPPEGRGETMEERITANGSTTTGRTCAPMTSLVSTLSNALQSPVDDETMLTGRWDSEISFMNERRRRVDPTVAARDPSEAPALLTAVQEQLGLKLESRRGPVEVLVVDSASPPSEN